MILGPDKKKLSKRHGAVSVEEFRDRGYLAEAMRNYLALIGWSFDDQTTVMTTPELVERFTIERVNSSPGVFDLAKLEWLNGEHLRLLEPAAVRRRAAAATWSGAARRWPSSRERVAEVAPMVQEKLRDAGPVRGVRRLPVRARSMYDARGASGGWSTTRTRRALWSPPPRRCRRVVEWDAASIEEALRGACEETGLKPRVLFGPVRVAISGRTVAPGLFESLVLLGREESLDRIAMLGRRFAVEG